MKKMLVNAKNNITNYVTMVNKQMNISTFNFKKIINFLTIHFRKFTENYFKITIRTYT